MSPIKQRLLEAIDQTSDPLLEQTLAFLKSLTVTPPSLGQPSPAIASILNRLAAANACAEIADPSQWQREIRGDRPLPGRDE
jgi:hypothetical protein